MDVIDLLLATLALGVLGVLVAVIASVIVDWAIGKDDDMCGDV